MSEKKELQKKAKKLGLKLHGRMSEENMKAAIAGADTASQHIEGADAISQETQEAAEEALTESMIEGAIHTIVDDIESGENKIVQPGTKSPLTEIEMNDLALRIWDGQSVSLPRKLRESRIVSRLKDKGYTDEELIKLELPD
jgi:hypothetical protein